VEARVQAMEEAMAVGGAAAASVTPGMIDRLAALAERLGGVLDALTSPEMLALLEQVRTSAPALTRLLQRLDQLEQAGTLDVLLDLAGAVQAAGASLTDTMVHRAGNTLRVLLELGDLAMVSGLADKAPALMEALQQARADAAADSQRIGPLDLLRTLKEPEIQKSLKLLLAMARRMPKALESER
jgi:uncharacterized protein YjgD (DUF1641 family)